MTDLAFTNLFTDNGVSIQLQGQALARGGEGTIHRINQVEGYLAKIYNQPPEEPRIAKLKAMIAADSPALLEAAAWPVGLIFDSSKKNARVLGFMMPEVVEHRELHQLFSPAERKLHFPAANWKMLALAGSNLARVVAAVHQSGGVIGDLNQNNVLVSSRATVMLIDCDSFQFRRSDGQFWTCDVGKEEYLPPELQSANLRGLVRTPDQDNFSLAVLLFQLLFMGRHPFSGRHQRSTDFPIGAAITEGAYFYGSLASKKGLAPPPAVITPGVLPPGLAEFFERAFLTDNRPTAREWSEQLLHFASQLKVCPESLRHLFYEPVGGCPWCSLKKAIRVDYFPEAIQTTSSASSANILAIELNNEQSYQLIASVPPFSQKYQRPSIHITDLRPPSPIPRGLEKPEPLLLEQEPAENSNAADLFFLYFGIFMLIASFAIFWYQRKAGVIFIFGALCNLSIILFLQFVGVKKRYKSWLETCDSIRAANDELKQAWHNHHKTWLDELDQRKQKRDTCLALLSDRENQWTDWLDKIRNDDALLRKEAESLNNSIQKKMEKYRHQLDDQSRARQAEAVERWLESHFIRDATIPQIGRTRVAMLASFGVETAADVVRMFQNQAYTIPGFGQRLMNNLWYWAAEIQSRYKPDPSASLPLELGLKIKSHYEPELRTMAHRLEMIASDIYGFGPLVESKKPKVIAFLYQATKDYLEAQADVEIMEFN